MSKPRLKKMDWATRAEQPTMTVTPRSFLFAVCVVVAVQADYRVVVVNRSLTSSPLLQYNTTSWAQNTLNPSWLPVPGSSGGGIFFRTIAAAGTPGYNAIGFVRADTADGLHFPRVTLDNLLDDAAGADPRATARPATGEYFVTYQIGDVKYPGRHTFISRTKTPQDIHSWVRIGGAADAAALHKYTQKY
jgi:hypothetical protein